MTLQQQIEQEAREYADKAANTKQVAQWHMAYKGYIVGATKYAQQWRPIKEHEGPEPVLLCHPHGVYPVVGYKMLSGDWHSHQHALPIYPTHFMPLPELPITDKP